MFIETKEYRLFQEFCDACRRDCYIGLCYGAAGVGKTLSARYYTDPTKIQPTLFSPSEGTVEKGLDNHVVLYTPSTVNSPGKVGREIGRCRTNFNARALSRLEKEEKPKLEAIEENMNLTRGAGGELAGAYSRHQDAYFAAYKEYRTRRREIRDEPVLLVIDESDRLTTASLEQVRAIFDQGGLGVVLIGMPGIEKRLSRFAQLYSRVGFVHEFPPLAKQEVRDLLKDGWKPLGVELPSDGVTDEEALAAILRITRGNFRSLEKLLTQIARVLEINSLSKVTRAVVELAGESLVIGAVDR